MIYGELPTKRVVYAACDKKYFHEHAPSLVYSLNDIGKDIHIHICEPDPNCHNLEAILKKDIDVDITFTYNDIGVTPMDWEKEGTKVAAGCVYLTADALSVAKAVNERIKEGPMRWFIDQIALAETFARVEDKDITKFDGNFMDWEFIDGTVIWTGKGPRKYENQKYLNAKKKFNRLSNAIPNIWDKA